MTVVIMVAMLMIMLTSISDGNDSDIVAMLMIVIMMVMLTIISDGNDSDTVAMLMIVIMMVMLTIISDGNDSDTVAMLMIVIMMVMLTIISDGNDSDTVAMLMIVIMIVMLTIISDGNDCDRVAMLMIVIMMVMLTIISDGNDCDRVAMLMIVIMMVMLTIISDGNDCDIVAMLMIVIMMVMLTIISDGNDCDIEINRLQEDNVKLKERVQMLERQASNALDEKTKLSSDLSKARSDLNTKGSSSVKVDESAIQDLSDKVATLNQDLRNAEDLAKKKCKTTEEELANTKHYVLALQHEIELLNKEIDKKFSETSQYKNLKKMLETKNVQIKDLRARLRRHEPNAEI
eukprot:gene14218-5235_t